MMTTHLIKQTQAMVIFREKVIFLVPLAAIFELIRCVSHFYTVLIKHNVDIVVCCLNIPDELFIILIIFVSCLFFFTMYNQVNLLFLKDFK